MADTFIITYNELIKMFEDFVTNHKQLRTFGNGPTSEIGTSKQIDYPLLWSTHRTPSTFNITNKTLIPQMNLTFIIVDQINIQENYEDTNGVQSNNGQEVLSDTFQIAQDLVTYISTELGTYGVMFSVDTLSIEPVYDELPDKVNGWVLDVTLQLRHTNCTYPTN